MKRLDISISIITIIIIILIICSLRSEWQKLKIITDLDKTESIYTFERNLYEGQINVTDPSSNIKTIHTVSWYEKDQNCTTITALGAISLILLFIQIINILKTNIKVINAKVYPYFEKIGLSSILVAIFCFIAFLVALKLEILSCYTGTSSTANECVTSKLISKYSNKYEITEDNQTLTIQFISSSAVGFNLMVASFVLAIVYTILTIFRYRQITSPSSSIDYRFLYSGESSFLEDDEYSVGDDDTFPTTSTL